MFLLDLFFSVQPHTVRSRAHVCFRRSYLAAFLSHARRQFETQEHVVVIHINHIRCVQFILAILRELNSSALHFPLLSLSFGA